jgi:hypothetical protein
LKLNNNFSQNENELLLLQFDSPQFFSINAPLKRPQGQLQGQHRNVKLRAWSDNRHNNRRRQMSGNKLHQVTNSVADINIVTLIAKPGQN